MSMSQRKTLQSGTSKSSARLRNLIDLKSGQYLDGDLQVDLIPPDGFDMEKFYRGRIFFCENLFCCCVAMFFALILGLAIPDFLKTLVFTQKSDTPRKALMRYIATFQHIAAWHYGNVWEIGSDAQKSILTVRQAHQSVRKMLGKDGYSDYLSQYHMALVQSSFFYGPVLYTHHFGIKCPRSRLDDYVYFWYGIGYLLGIDSEHNLCANGQDQAKIFCRNIQDEILLPNLKTPSDDFRYMSAVLLEGWKTPLHGTMTVSFVKAFLLNISGHDNQKLCISDRLRFSFWKLIFFVTRNVGFIKNLLNSTIERAFSLKFKE